ANHGLALWKTGRREDALPMIRAASGRLPELAVVHLNLAELCGEMRLRDEGRAALGRARPLVPKIKGPPELRREIDEQIGRCEALLAGLAEPPTRAEDR
ncbi:MAG: hypothetical protein OER88_09780, partial [Planctomycetota bacterium]|nr:hypothetical protein [Planctomycetota bacterium]